MKKIYALTLLFFLCTQFSFSQELGPDPLKFDAFLAEVYTGSGTIDVQKNTRKYTYLKELYTERIAYVTMENPLITKHSYLLLSEIPLITLYNHDIKADEVFYPLNFNPFKYNFDFYSKKIQIIRVDQSDYFIVIYPQIVSLLNRP